MWIEQSAVNVMAGLIGFEFSQPWLVANMPGMNDKMMDDMNEVMIV